MRTLPLAFPFLATLTGALLPAQSIPGVDATLRAERSIVPAGHAVPLLLTLDVKEAAAVPADLLNGLRLEARGGAGAPVQIQEPGSGGTVQLAAGTKVERRIQVPGARLSGIGSAAAGDVTNVEISWIGMAGVSCVVKLAPDVSKLNVDDLDLDKTKVVLVTSLGDMTLTLRHDKAPNTVKNFVKLAKEAFYDGTRFHRVIRDFMIQGGDPNTKTGDPATWGQGDPGYKIDAEFNDMKHLRGVVSMARGPDVNSAGSQFFICHKDAAHLDGQYTAFGSLESGADVLNAIATTPVGGPTGAAPLTPVVLHHAIVLPVLKQ